jgi:hypothetical protein
MVLTKDPDRIHHAHHCLQRLEDCVVGFSNPVTRKHFGEFPIEEVNRIYANRLNNIFINVWEAIYFLNEAYDEVPNTPCRNLETTGFRLTKDEYHEKWLEHLERIEYTEKATICLNFEKMMYG